MESPLISVVCGTSRHGGFDMLFPSLAIAGQAFGKPWELVLADEHHSERTTEVDTFAKQWSVPLKHVRAEPLPYISPANTYNAALAAASGELVGVIGDFSWIPEQYLTAIWDQYGKEPTRTLAAAYCDYNPPEWKTKPSLKEFSAFKEPFDAVKTFAQVPARFEERQRSVQRWVSPARGLVSDEWVLGLISAPLDELKAVNGFDQCFSGGKGYSDHDLAYRLTLGGRIFILDFSLVIRRIVQNASIFEEKKASRTNDDNKRRRERKHELLRKGFLGLNTHRGLRDLRNLADRRAVIEGGGASDYARRLCALLQGFGLHVAPSSSDMNYSQTTDYVVYGVSPPDVQRCLNLAPRLRCWLWWTGTDAANLVSGKFGLPAPLFARYPNFSHLCHHSRQKKMLASVGIDAVVVPPAVEAPPDAPWPEEPAVLCYLPSERPEVYLHDEHRAVMEKLPDVRFLVYGNRTAFRSLPPNAVQRGWVNDVNALYREAGVLLRLTAWDGFPETTAAMKLMGRQVVCSYPYEHCFAAADAEDAAKKVEAALRLGPDAEGREWYRKNVSPRATADAFARAVFGVEGLP